MQQQVYCFHATLLHRVCCLVACIVYVWWALRIYLQKNVSYVPNEVISKSWIVKTADQRRESLLELFTIQPTILHDVHTTPRTKYERYAILASEFKSVAHIASLSVESTEELRSQLRNFITNTLKSKQQLFYKLNKTLNLIVRR